MSDQAPQRPRRLGRGINVLLSDIEHKPNNIGVDALEGRQPALESIEVADIIPNKFQPRTEFDEAQLRQLADSIRQAGVVQPIIVRRRSSGATPRFELVAGERRWRAARLAGLGTIPAVVRELSDEESAQFALVENLQRTDLNPIDRAWAFRRLSEQFGLTQAQIAERVGIDRSTVTNFVRLTDLEMEIQDMVAAGRLSGGHARAVLAIAPGPSRVAIAKQAAAESWSVRRVEKAAATLTAAAGQSGERPDIPSTPAMRTASLADLEKRLGDYLGTQVTIRVDGNGPKGRIVISFYGLDHFDGLLSRIGYSTTP